MDEAEQGFDFEVEGEPKASQMTSAQIMERMDRAKELSTNALVRGHGTSGTGIMTWDGAAQRGASARNERQRIISQCMKKDVDYGTIPGTSKDTLFKSGALKIADSLELYPAYEIVSQREDFDGPLFFYRYRCSLKQRGSDLTMATGIGSCSTAESRYAWRQGKRTCPKCGSEAAIIKGKEEYGGGWLCWQKKEGCGAKFADGDKAIEDQKVERIANPDILDQVNTVDKMAQKRALVAAALDLGFSEDFTQDLDDMGPGPEGAPAAGNTRPTAEDANAALDGVL